MLVKEKSKENYEKAEKDFEMAIKISPQNGLGYIGRADCLRFLGLTQ